jgi:hypothetical protein
MRVHRLLADVASVLIDSFLNVLLADAAQRPLLNLQHLLLDSFHLASLVAGIASKLLLSLKSPV